MVRQYRIHTDLDGSNNKIYDMTNGLIRFYQPSDLGIINSTNIWQSQGIGVMGNNNISHPDIDFKFETFGNSLEENYRIFHTFINDVLAKRYVTLEYTNEIGNFYADIQLSKITKTEGYGFDGQFSETISFIPVNMWYVYEQLKFSKVQNGEIGGNTKIYGNKETTVYPNLNLLDGTKNFKPSAGINKPNQNAGQIYFAQNKTVADLFKAGDYITISYDVEFLNTELYSSSEDVFMQIQTWGGGWTWLAQVKAKNVDGKFYTRDTFKSTTYIENPTHKVTVSRTIQLTQDFITANGTVNSVHALFNNIPVDANINITNLKIEPAKNINSVATPWMPSSSEVQPSDYRNYGSYKYDYTYFGEDNIERFSKWKIDNGIFSFTALMTPSQNVENMSDYGVRFLDEQFNEYTALIFGNTTKPDSIQFNTDVNDEYYQAQIGTSTINMFSALNYQRFRTRFIQKGTMELVNVDVVEMNVKRKVEFV